MAVVVPSYSVYAYNKAEEIDDETEQGKHLPVSLSRAHVAHSKSNRRLSPACAYIVYNSLKSVMPWECA